jgi:hypothetical protein
VRKQPAFTVQYLDLDELRGGDQAHPRLARTRSTAGGPRRGGPRAVPAEAEKRAEHVGVPMCVAGLVLDLGVDHTGLEGGDMLEDMHARMAGDRKRAAQIRHLGQLEGLVGETEVPKLFVLLVCMGWAMRDTGSAQGKGPQPAWTMRSRAIAIRECRPRAATFFERVKLGGPTSLAGKWVCGAEARAIGHL